LGCAPESGARASVRPSASPLYPGQRLPRRLLLPVRPGIRADNPAADADHARPERRHRDVIRPPIGAQHGPVLTIPARHVERPDAELAHIAQVIGSIRRSKRPIHRHPLSSQGSEQIIAPPGDEPSNPMQQRKARVGNLAIQVRAVDGQQHYRCHGYQKPPHPRFLGRDARWSRSPTASPGQRSLAVPSGASSARRRVPRAWSRWGL